MQSLCVCAGAFKCMPVFDCVSAVHVCVYAFACVCAVCVEGGRQSRAEHCSAGSRTAFLPVVISPETSEQVKASKRGREGEKDR